MKVQAVTIAISYIYIYIYIKKSYQFDVYPLWNMETYSPFFVYVGLFFWLLLDKANGYNFELGIIPILAQNGISEEEVLIHQKPSSLHFSSSNKYSKDNVIESLAPHSFF